ncbi:MAG: ROK family protein [Ruminococcaceae bacterium]|nr:ROK family protein [Oscillospiraceae bacterium]
MYILGFDIGGTKCAAVTAEYNGKDIKLLKKDVCATDHSINAHEMLERIILLADGILDKTPDAIGISCGGPLDSGLGMIMSPPNLPGWDNIEIVRILEKHFGAPARLQNDANACALAEWKFGAGIGCKNMIFLTFGTGLGSGLILNERLYEGTNGNAGEIGHIRLASAGPIGYGKNGSFEGFCSGGGIAQLGYTEAVKAITRGEHPLYFQDGMSEKDITAKAIARAAEQGDPTALRVYRISGKYLGKGLSVLIDILNPEKIIIGSIFARSGQLLTDSMKKEIKKEALSLSASCCKIECAMLGEAIGDLAAIATALT